MSHAVGHVASDIATQTAEDALKNAIDDNFWDSLEDFKNFTNFTKGWSSFDSVTKGEHVWNKVQKKAQEKQIFFTQFSCSAEEEGEDPFKDVKMHGKEQYPDRRAPDGVSKRATSILSKSAHKPPDRRVRGTFN